MATTAWLLSKANSAVERLAERRTTKIMTFDTVEVANRRKKGGRKKGGRHAMRG